MTPRQNIFLALCFMVGALDTRLTFHQRMANPDILDWLILMLFVVIPIWGAAINIVSAIRKLRAE